MTSERKDRVGLPLLSVSTTVATAQQATVNDRVAKAMPTKYEPAQCSIKPNHFKVGSAAGYLKSAIETDVPESKARILGQGEKVLLEAIQQNGQDKNPAAWYYLGRIYLTQGRLLPADTALTKAAQMAPDCAKEIDIYRRNAWVALVKGGSKFEEHKNIDSALALYQQANMIFRGRRSLTTAPRTIFNTKGQADSAADVLRQGRGASANATDTTESEHPQPFGLQSGRAAAQREEVRQAAEGVRAVPQVGARTTPRPSAAWPGPTAAPATRRRRRWSSNSWRRAAPAGGARRRRGRGHRRT